MPGTRDRSIAGVVADVKNAGLANAAQPEVYVGIGQTTATTITFVVETDFENPLELSGVVEQAIRRFDPDVAPSQVQTMGQRLTTTLASLRFAMVLLFLFGGVALFLSVVGIYGICSYSIRSRAQEMAVRMTFGASPLDIIRSVVVEMVGISLTGSAVAIGTGVWSQHLLVELLGHSASNGAVLIGVCIVMAMIACGAAYVPTHRTLAADIFQTLKS